MRPGNAHGNTHGVSDRRRCRERKGGQRQREGEQKRSACQRGGVFFSCQDPNIPQNVSYIKEDLFVGAKNKNEDGDVDVGTNKKNNNSTMTRVVFARMFFAFGDLLTKPPPRREKTSVDQHDIILNGKDSRTSLANSSSSEPCVPAVHMAAPTKRHGDVWR